MKIDIIGASNAALSFYRDVTGAQRITTEVNLGSVLSEKMDCPVSSFIAFTIAKASASEKSYVDCAMDVQGGDILIVQGAGNDAGVRVPMGSAHSENPHEYFGALNCIAKQCKSKYKAIIFTTGFNALHLSDYCAYNRAILSVAEKHKLACIDFFQHPAFSDSAILPDGEHMREDGLCLYADTLIQKINELL